MQMKYEISEDGTHVAMATKHVAVATKHVAVATKHVAAATNTLLWQNHVD